MSEPSSGWEPAERSEVAPVRAPSAVRYRFRYLPGVVGEADRVVHQALSTDGALVFSLCRRRFPSAKVEIIDRTGMPCMQCAAHAAAAATSEALEAANQRQIVGRDG